MGLTNNLGKLSNMITSTGSAVSMSGTLTLATTSLTGTLQFGTSTAATIGYDAGAGLMSFNIGAGAAASSPYYQFSSDGSAKVTILKGGNVGIGTANPQAALHITGAISSAPTADGVLLGVQSDFAVIHLNGSASTGSLIDFSTNGTDRKGRIEYNNVTNDMIFSTNASQKLTITSAGNVGIGTTSTSAKTEIRGNGNRAINTNGTLFVTSGGTPAQGTEEGAQISFGAWLNGDLGNPYPVAGIKGVTESNTTDINKGALIFATMNSTVLAERMRIGSNGNAAIGDTNTTYGKLYLNGYGAPNSLMTQPVLIASSGANAVQLGSDGTHALIGAGNSGSSLILLSRASGEYTQAIVIASNNTVKINNLGSGTVSATSGVLSTSSDMNLKVEDGFINNALEKVLNLKPKYFHWKEESGLPTDIRQLGFYAQEVNEALGEEAASRPKDENDKWGIYDRSIIAMLTKAIQELNEKLIRNNIN